MLNDNPFFVGGVVTPWTALGGTLAASTPNADTSPPYATGVLWTASGSGGGYITESTAPFTAVTGQPYLVQAWVYYPLGGSVHIGFGWTGHADTLTTVTVAGGTWTPVSTVVTAPSTSGWPKVGPATSTVGALFIAEAITVTGQIPGQLISAGSISAGQVNFNARTIGGITTTIASSPPAGAQAGDLWWDNTVVNGLPSYKLNQYNGTSWNAYQFGTGAFAAGSITAAQIAANTITASQLAAGIIYAGIVDTTVISAGNLLIYSGTPGAGTLVGSFTSGSGTDTYGNAYPVGVNSTQGTFTGVTIGNAGISGSNITGGTLNNVGISSPNITGGAISETSISFDQVGGVLLVYSSSTNVYTLTTGSTWTAPAGTYTQGKVECEGGDGGGGGGSATLGGGEAGAGASYSCEPYYPLTPGTVYGTAIGQGGSGGTTGNAGQNGTQTAFDTTNLTGGGVYAPGGNAGSFNVGGTNGGTSSNTISHYGGNGGGNPNQYNASAGGGGRAGATGNGSTGHNPTGNASPGAGGAAGTGYGGIAGSNGVLAATNGNSGNAGGSGAGASSGTTQGQVVYSFSDSGSYRGYDSSYAPDSFIGHGTMYQGGETASGGTNNGTMCSMAIINGNPASDLSGVTIDQVTVRFTNLHSWYNSGMYLLIGYVSNTSLPGSWYGNGVTNLGQYWIQEGYVTWFDLTSTGLGAALQGGSANALTLGYYGQPTYDLWNYGYMYGSGGSSSYNPQLIINYHTGAAPVQAGSGSNGLIRITTTTSQQLIASIAPVAGTDASSNAYGAGYTGQVQAITPASSPTVSEVWHSLPLTNSWSVRAAGTTGSTGCPPIT